MSSSISVSTLSFNYNSCLGKISSTLDFYSLGLHIHTYVGIIFRRRLDFIHSGFEPVSIVPEVDATTSAPRRHAYSRLNDFEGVSAHRMKLAVDHQDRVSAI
jgi:hypothetical protein